MYPPRYSFTRLHMLLSPRVAPRVVAILITILLIAVGCATSTRYLNAAHPQYGQTEFDRDLYECRRENTRPKVSSVVVPNVGTYDAGMVVDEDMARSCLAARGWRPVNRPPSLLVKRPLLQRPMKRPAPSAFNDLLGRGLPSHTRKSRSPVTTAALRRKRITSSIWRLGLRPPVCERVIVW
jgi:hypothetical protein